MKIPKLKVTKRSHYLNDLINNIFLAIQNILDTLGLRMFCARAQVSSGMPLGFSK